MSHQPISDGPFRIEQTFSFPSNSFEVVQALDAGQMALITPATIDAEHAGNVQLFPENGSIGELPIENRPGPFAPAPQLGQ
jgi:hypothetical protein